MNNICALVYFQNGKGRISSAAVEPDNQYVSIIIKQNWPQINNNVMHSTTWTWHHTSSTIQALRINHVWWFTHCFFLFISSRYTALNFGMHFKILEIHILFRNCESSIKQFRVLKQRRENVDHSYFYTVYVCCRTLA